jgi:hypothetical protein
MSDIKPPILIKEDWVTFIRYYCKEGYIDKWMGDCIDNPNNLSKHMMRLNSTAIYYRVNNKRWRSSYELRRGLHHDLNNPEMRELFTAEEIWNDKY